MAWIRACRPTGHMVNDNKLTPCFLAFHMLGKGLPRKEQQEFIDWAVEMGERHIRSWKDRSAGGNKAAKRIKMVVLAAAVADRKDWLEWADEKIQLHLQASLRPDGRSLDLEHRDAMHYHLSCLSEMLQGAHAGRLSAIDSFDRTTPEGASIRKSIEFMLPYARGEKVHKEWVNSHSSIDQRRWEAGDPYYRPGKPWDPSEAYTTLVLASSFDPSYKKLLATLRPKGLTGPTFFELIASAAAR
ncbi:MAG: alginate lyase family protein [Planctomycetes bacterium]|nr:alginate lyase family protein [Planctomycetota bacterium]